MTADQRWPSILSELEIPRATCIAVSDIDPGRRSYVCDGRLYKILCHEIECTQYMRRQTPHGEYRVLRSLDGVEGVPQDPVLISTPAFDCLHYHFVPGIPLSKVSEVATEISPAATLAPLAKILFEISLRGVAHNDITLENVVVDERSMVTLIDFDQCSLISIPTAFLVNFAPIARFMKHSFVNYSSLARQLYRQSFISKAHHIRHLIQRRRARAELPSVERTTSRRLRSLYEAWVLALDSDANSPGVPVAYYELCENGYIFPGERSWQVRWDILRKGADFEGRRILELGCNMSLLSCFLLKECAAASSLCVDADARILSAAHLVADAYAVSPIYQQVNFDGDADWEVELARFEPDIVFALSVLNWVEDKARFLRFLGRFDEVIFEGHDSLEVERSRFLDLGFKTVELVAMSDRDRPLLHCTKA